MKEVPLDRVTGPRHEDVPVLADKELVDRVAGLGDCRGLKQFHHSPSWRRQATGARKDYDVKIRKDLEGA